MNRGRISTNPVPYADEAFALLESLGATIDRRPFWERSKRIKTVEWSSPLRVLAVFFCGGPAYYLPIEDLPNAAFGEDDVVGAKLHDDLPFGFDVLLKDGESYSVCGDLVLYLYEPEYRAKTDAYLKSMD